MKNYNFSGYRGIAMYERCKEILLKEHEAVAKAAALQKMVQDAVQKREWTDFEAHFGALNAISAEIAALERERETVFAGFSGGVGQGASAMLTAMPGASQQAAPMAVELAGGDAGRFYALCMRFTVEQRGEICAIYRSLKLQALKLRLDNESLLEYVSGIKATLAGFFELAFPDRGGKIYTPRGTPVSRDMRSMVLNQRM
jgi:hypothetical protein